MSGSDLAAAAERLRASVVQVRGANGEMGGGAGIAWREGGDIVTSAHVVSSRHVHVVRPDGRVVPGEVVSRDPHRDLALVRASGAALPAVRSADPRGLRPGALLIAVGHPLGVTDAVTTGVLQATGPLPPGLGVPGLARALAWVQASLRLAPGNSGGPLADAEGRVVGVAAMVVAGLGLAVPAPEVEAFLAGAQAGRAAGRSRRPAYI